MSIFNKVISIGKRANLIKDHFELVIGTYNKYMHYKLGSPVRLISSITLRRY